MTKTVNRKSLISWIVTLALPIIILLIPTTEAFTSDIRTFFAITLMGIAMFCFDEMDNAIAGILMMLLYIMTGIAPSGTVFSAWTNDIPWYILATLLLVNILEDTTILKRIAYHCIILAGGTYTGIVFGITLTAILSIIIVPGTWTSMAVAAITLSIIKSLELARGQSLRRHPHGCLLRLPHCLRLRLLPLRHPDVPGCRRGSRRSRRQCGSRSRQP